MQSTEKSYAFLHVGCSNRLFVDRKSEPPQPSRNFRLVNPLNVHSDRHSWARTCSSIVVVNRFIDMNHSPGGFPLIIFYLETQQNCLLNECSFNYYYYIFTHTLLKRSPLYPLPRFCTQWPELVSRDFFLGAKQLNETSARRSIEVLALTH